MAGGVRFVFDSFFEGGVLGVHVECWKDEQLTQIFGVCSEFDVRAHSKSIVIRSDFSIP